MNTQDYLSALREKLGVSTDYALAKALGVSKQAAGRWSKGLSGFDDETAKRVASLLGIHPGFVMLDMHRERAANDETRAVWDEIFKGFRVPLHIAKLGLSPRV
ncbi:helix-turn-helix domain-containing protein [Lacisediminimonas profundi]|uniref:helix-turn-helix domain-containing protein n=1 Tax=Lacisediminimonas profundi TaxID=2603856 RepID=UPI00124BB399|nr:helix-turn-helix transcriptional regulator [Lacisediminimonas profundi]